VVREITGLGIVMSYTVDMASQTTLRWYNNICNYPKQNHGNSCFQAVPILLNYRDELV